MNKILVTGGTGFIGSRLVTLLQSRGYQVRVLIRSEQQKKRFSTETEIIIGDLIDPYSLTQACTGIDTIYHLAGLAHDNKINSKQHLNINFYGTNNLIQAAITNNVKRFIYFSSVKAEDPNSPYGIAKRKAEELLLHEAKSHHFDATILRPSLVYGAGCKGNLESMIKAIDKGYFIPIPDTKNSRSMISLDDLCEAALMVDTPAANGKIYTLSDGKDYSTRHLYEEMCKALGKSIPKWYVPYTFFLFLAKLGDFVSKIFHIPMPFNSQTLDKMFGSAQYNSDAIRTDLDFKTNMEINHVLPAMVDAYKGRA